jgi:hypothetical protein
MCEILLPPKSALRNYSRLKVPWESTLPPEYIYLSVVSAGMHTDTLFCVLVCTARDYRHSLDILAPQHKCSLLHDTGQFIVIFLAHQNLMESLYYVNTTKILVDYFNR